MFFKEVENNWRNQFILKLKKTDGRKRGDLIVMGGPGEGDLKKMVYIAEKPKGSKIC